MRWDDYTEKALPGDEDTIVAKDNASAELPIKRVKFSSIYKWIVNKLGSESIAELNTENKTIVGAMNEVLAAGDSNFEVVDGNLCCVYEEE